MKMDTGTIKKIATETNTAKVVFNALSERQRNRQVTDLRRFKMRLLANGNVVKESEYNSLFQKLEAEGVGTFVKESGKPPRFKWNMSLKEVGAAAVGHNNTPKSVTKPAPIPVPRVSSATASLIYKGVEVHLKGDPTEILDFMKKCLPTGQ